MSFLSEEAFKKYSLFGSFENQLKYNEFNLNENNFEVLQFQNFCGGSTQNIFFLTLLFRLLVPLSLFLQNGDVKWYPPFLDKVYEKEHKLNEPYHKHDPKRRLKQHHIGSSITKPQTANIPYSQTQIQAHAAIESKLDTKLESKLEEPIKPTTSRVELTRVNSSELDETKTVHTNISQPESKSQQNTAIDQRVGFQAQKRNGRSTPTYSFDNTTYKVIKNWYPLRFKLAFPKKSLLNSQEQKEYLELNSKYRTRSKVAVSEVKYYKKYLHYKTLIEKERKEFFEYLKEYFNNAQEDYEFMNTLNAKYISEMIESLEASVNSYDKFYVKHSEFLLNNSMFNQHRASSLRPIDTFQFEKMLLQLGNLAKIILPSITLTAQPILTTDYTSLNKRVPVAKTAKKLSKISIMDDENAKQLALKYDCDVVMTNSAFVYIVYHLSSTKEQNLDTLKMPFSVKILEESKKKILFIDKPFVEKHLNKREKNEKFFKRSLMVTLVKQNPTRLSRGARGKTESNKTEPTKNLPTLTTAPRELQKLNVDYNLVDKMDSFGCSEDNLGSTESNLQNIFNKKLSNELNAVENDLKKETRNKEDNRETKSEIIKPDTVIESLNQSSDDESSTDENSRLFIADTSNNCTKSPNHEISSIAKNQNDDLEYSSTDEDEPLSSLCKKNSKAINDNHNIKNDNNNNNEPKSPTMDVDEGVFDFIKPKVIPLEKFDTIEKMNIKEKIEKIHDSVIKEIEEEKNDPILPVEPAKVEEKLSLFDLISKMQEKLINAPVSSSTANTTQGTTVTGTYKASAPVENAKNYTYIDNMHDNLNYSIWTFNLNKPIRVLIRASIDGYVNTETSSFNSIVLHPKLEYQPQFGCEELTLKDLSKMWAKSFLRNGCDVFLCRINVFTSKLISVTKLKHSEILPNGCIFNPNQALIKMRSLFEKLQDLDVGNYLLAKETNEDSLIIYKSSQPKSGAFDLHFFYNGYTVEEKEKPPICLPIDPELLLPYHITLNRVPCLFEPIYDRDWNKKYQKGSPPSAKKKNNKRKRKK